MHCRFIGQAFKGKRSLTIRQKGDFFYYTTDSDFMHRIVKRKYGNHGIMPMRFCELKEKEVVNICNGKCLGGVVDLQINVCSGAIEALIVPGPGKFCGFFGTDSEYVIPFACIKKIGPDIILVEIKEEKFLQKY